MKFSSRQRVYLAAALASLLLSFWYLHLKGVVNQDAIRYLTAAYANGDAGTGYPGRWIFFAWLIRQVADLTGMIPEEAAHLLGVLFDLVTVVAFLRLLERLGGGFRVLVIGAVVVLVLPYLNDNRAEIIRDHGYWALSLVAMLFYVELFRRFSWRDLAGWYLAMGLATLFRVEGALFVAFMPLGLLLGAGPLRRRLANLVKAWLPLVGVALLLGAAQGVFESTRLAVEVGQGWNTLRAIFLDNIPARIEAVRLAFSPWYSHGPAVWVFWFGVAADILNDLVNALSWPFFLILALRRWFPAPALPADYRRVLAVYGAVSLLALLFQELRGFVMVTRYTEALALMLLPVVVFSLDHLWLRYREGRAGRRLPALVAFAIFALAADSLIETPGNKGYMLEAGRWAVAHMPERAQVAVDDEKGRLRYYLNGRKPGGRRVVLFANGGASLKGFDYAVVTDPDSGLAKAVARAGGRVVATFARRRGAPVKLYALGSPQD